jgi:glycosyltransferase involved in cell wall biosynthesis
MVAPLWAIITKKASKIICPSKVLRELVLKQSKDLNVEIIPNGIETERFVANQEKGNRILIVSRMIERKGIQFFLQAIAQTSSDWEVHIVGDGPYLHKLREKSMGSKWKIKFWGWLDRESPKFKELYETSSVFVFPSEAENFPIVLLEAMASGLAIITTEGTGCEEVVGDAAVLVPPRNSSAILNALLLMLQYPKERRKMGKTARRRVEECFSWTAVGEQYIRLYKNTLEELKTKL